MQKFSSLPIRLWSVLLLGFFTFGGLSAKYEDTVEKSFATTGPGTLNMDLQGHRWISGLTTAGR